MQNTDQLNFYYNQDGNYLDDIPENLLDLLMKNGYIINRGNLNFCGFVTSGNDVLVSFPKGDIEYTENNISILFQSLIKYSKLPDHEFSGLEEEINIDFLSLYYSLVENWKMYGIYKKAHKRSHKSLGGNINWGKTINKVSPIISSDGILYPELISTSRCIRQSTLIQKIHYFVLNIIFKKIGWLLNIEDSDYYEISKYNTSPCSINEAINELNKELREEFTHYKSKTLELLLEFFNQGTGATLELFGVKYFWVIWEKACADVLCSQKNISLPQPVFTKSDNSRSKKRAEKIKQRHDMFFIHNSNAIVADAKYYDVSKSFPSWADLSKQFHYCNSFKSLGFEEITNVFIFPQVKDDKKHLLIKKIDMSGADAKPDLLQLYFGEIICIYLEPTYVLKSWVTNSQDLTVITGQILLNKS